MHDMGDDLDDHYPYDDHDNHVERGGLGWRIISQSICCGTFSIIVLLFSATVNSLV